MAKTIGVTLSERIAAGLVVDHKLAGAVRRFPEGTDDDDESGLVELHTDALVDAICKQVVLAADGTTDLTAVGVALPGLVKNGVVEEAPNLPQLKGARIEELLTAQLRNLGVNAPVYVAGFERGVRPIGDWSMLITLSRCWAPSIVLWCPGTTRDR